MTQSQADALRRTSDPSARALIVDVDVDDQFHASLRTCLACDLGFSQIEDVANIEGALDLLEGGARFRIAIVDLYTLGEENADSLRALRERFPEMTLAIIAASTARRDILLALEAGVNGYIPKASGMRIAGAALRTILSGAIYVPSSIAVLNDKSDEQETMNNEQLTPRQSEVLHLVVAGKSNKEIARHLNLAEGTIKVHMSALFRGLGVTSRSAAAALGARIDARIDTRSGASIGQQAARGAR